MTAAQGLTQSIAVAILLPSCQPYGRSASFGERFIVLDMYVDHATQSTDLGWTIWWRGGYLMWEFVLCQELVIVKVELVVVADDIRPDGDFPTIEAFLTRTAYFQIPSTCHDRTTTTNQGSTLKGA